MGHAFHQLYYHFAWSTHSRIAVLRRDLRPKLLMIINDEAKKSGGWPIRHNAMPDHVHLLVRLPPTVTVSEFIGRVKGATSHRFNEEIRPNCPIQWQEGYGVVSLRKGEVEKVSRYIDKQETHHRLGKLSDLLERTEGDEDQADAQIPSPKGG